MALATGAQALLTYIRETTWGTTPGTPSMVVLPVSSAKMWRTTAEMDDKVIRSDRQVASWFGGMKESMLEIDFPLRAVAFRDVLSMGLWCADQASSPYTFLGGTTQNSATFELMHTDIGVYEKLTAATCESLTLSASDANIVNCKAAFRGNAYTVSGTSLDGSPTNPTDERPIATFTAALSSIVSTLGSTLKVSAFEIKIENNLDDVSSVTRGFPLGITAGRQKVTGSITIPFETATLLSAFMAETADGLTFSFRDAGAAPGTRTFVMTLPNIKYSAGEAPVDGEGLISVKLPFTALYDSGIGSAIQIVTTIL